MRWRLDKFDTVTANFKEENVQKEGLSIAVAALLFCVVTPIATAEEGSTQPNSGKSRLQSSLMTPSENPGRTKKEKKFHHGQQEEEPGRHVGLVRE